MLRVTTLTRKRQPTENEVGWQAHAAMETWLARADLKSSILLALQGVTAVLVVTSRDIVLASPWRWPLLVGLAALALLAIAICLTAAATLPVLGAARHHRAQHRSHMIYFGHLRHWHPNALASELTRISPESEAAMLARQLVFVARINWRKHRLLQLSVLLTILVILLLAASAIGAQLSAMPSHLVAVQP